MAAKDKKIIVERENSSFSELKRRFHQNPFVFVGTFVVLALIVVTFVFVPASAPKAGPAHGERLTFGSYNGKPIEYSQGNYFAEQQNYYAQQLRDTASDQNSQLAAFRIWRAAFESTVVHVGILDELDRAGYQVPQTLVDRRMAEYPAFLEEGKFSAAKYRAVSETDRAQLRDQMKGEIATERYAHDVLGVLVPSAEKAFIKSMASPERSFEYVALPVSSYPTAEVVAYVTSNPALFQTVKLSKITMVGKEGDAKKLRDSLVGGSTKFEDAVKAHSKDSYADKGGDMGVRYAYELKTEIPEEASRDSVMKLAAGAYSEPIKSGDNWVIYRCDEAATNADPKDPAVVDRAREYLQSFERGRIEDYLIAKANDLEAAAVGGDFSAAAVKLGLSAKKFGPIALNYGDVELFRSLGALKVPELSGAATNESFWKAAFATKLSGIAKPVVVGDNVIVLKVTEEKSADESSATMVDYYYPYLASQYSQRSLSNFFLTSKKLKDDFYQTFINTFLAKS